MDLNKPLSLKFDQDKLRQFIKDKKNRTYLILAGLLLAAALAVALALNMGVLTGADDETGAAANPAAGNTASVLPETSRTQNSSPRDPAEAQGSQRAIDPFAGPMTLKGILLGGGSSDLAIIQVGDTTYVVGKDMVLAETWTVSEINAKEVILTTQNETIRLEFSGRLTSKTKEPENTAQTKPQEPATESQAGGEKAQ